MLGKGRHDSRMAMAHDICADSSCLYGRDAKSRRFVALVFLGRDCCKATNRTNAGTLIAESRALETRRRVGIEIQQHISQKGLLLKCQRLLPRVSLM